IVEDDHPSAALASGDLVIFSSRTIPGNEKAVGKIVNGLVANGVEVVTDRTALVHVSGHPRRAELAKLYSWLKPKIAVPAHGEPLHLSEHVAFAKTQGVGQTVRALNGDVVRLADGDARVVGQIDHGRLYRDGEVVVSASDDCIGERRTLAVAGVVSIALALTAKGDMAGDPDVMIAGLPKSTREGAAVDAIVDAAIFETFESLPRGKRRDADFVCGAIERAVRNAVDAAWGKKPTVQVLIVET
ncbi:MAG TPA: MBL fold metallo-hydrolase RNA specificity domain-containing protein, partial [Roseiarcus sp.]|nr:MBL fold metallo-hydrolase RNA specificity domain-containing protein [Roseiarcus sp.]